MVGAACAGAERFALTGVEGSSKIIGLWGDTLGAAHCTVPDRQAHSVLGRGSISIRDVSFFVKTRAFEGITLPDRTGLTMFARA